MRFSTPLGSVDDTSVSKAHLYNIFSSDFKSRPSQTFRNKPIIFNDTIRDDGYEEGFWHLISKEPSKQRPRAFDPSRATKIGWIIALIDCARRDILRWEWLEGSGKTRQYFWAKQHDYVVILEERHTEVFMVSAFHVEPWKVKEFDRKYAASDPF